VVSTATGGIADGAVLIAGTKCPLSPLFAYINQLSAHFSFTSHSRLLTFVQFCSLSSHLYPVSTYFLLTFPTLTHFYLIQGDKKFAETRANKQNARTASEGGMLSGLAAGGESIFNGFSSGITGLIQRPMEETRKSGAMLILVLTC
jgi:hypothetical protein